MIFRLINFSQVLLTEDDCKSGKNDDQNTKNILGLFQNKVPPLLESN